MPHCIVEYSESLTNKIDLEGVLKIVTQSAMDSRLFASLDDIKARAVGFPVTLAGGEVAETLHVALKILSGRSEQQRKLLSKLVFSALDLHLPSEVLLSVEVIDIDREAYVKRQP